MAASEILYCSLLLIGVVTVVCGNEDMRDVINQVSQLQADLLGKIVPSYIHNQVEQAMTRILGDQSIYDRVRHLKNSQQKMKRHIHSMKRRLKTLEDDRDEKTRTIERLQEEYQQCEVRMTDLQREVNSSQLHVSNVYIELKQEAKSTQFKLDDIEDNYSKIMNNITLLRKVVANKLDNISRCCTCVEETMSSTDTSLSYPPTPVTTVTSRVVEERNRILVIQRRSSTVQYPHQIDLHSNEMSTYTYLQTSNVASSTFDSISRRIIFSRYSPGGIYSSRLDVGGVDTLRLYVRSFGIVVDADRGIIFLTTYHPRKTISRMTTTGKHFHSIVNITDTSEKPTGITIDGRQKVIYFCLTYILSSVDYDGKNLHTLVSTGLQIYTVVFDSDRNSLFFNLDKIVMMKSLATDRHTEIMELGYGI